MRATRLGITSAEELYVLQMGITCFLAFTRLRLSIFSFKKAFVSSEQCHDKSNQICLPTLQVSLLCDAI